MANQFQKHKLLFVIVSGFFILVVIIAITMFVENQLIKKFSTPQLIEKAFAEGEISEEERLLYLTYAIYEYRSLPARFQSKVPWEGTSIIRDINKTASSPSVLCSMSPHVQREIRRLLMPDTICN